MPHKIKTSEALAVLDQAFALAEDDFREGIAVSVPAATIAATGRLFSSITQAYREALVGCAVARIINKDIDIRLPATDSGNNAFSGRSLGENAVAPFLRDRAIPILASSPYLSALRGGARFMKDGEPRIQSDQGGFDALVAVVDYLRELDDGLAREYLRYLLRRFIELRESGNIPLKKIAKPNLQQLGRLIDGMLTVKSGGRIPAMLATAMFQTIGECHALGWHVEFQGINVADKASGAVGDISIRKSGILILGVEVTERPINQTRVTSTFEDKVSPSGLADYLFITTVKPDDGALAAARSYTGVGHEMNFVILSNWLHDNLSVVGPACRSLFQSRMIDLLGTGGIPAELKVAWNARMDQVLGIGPNSQTQE